VFSKGISERDVIYNPYCSPILGHLQLLSSAELDLALARADQKLLAVDVFLLTLAINLSSLFGIWFFKKITLSLKMLLLLLLSSFLVLVGLSWFSLTRYYFDERYGRREDWMALIEHVQAFSKPGDALILEVLPSSDLSWRRVKFFMNYYKGFSPYYGLFRVKDPIQHDEEVLLYRIISKYSRLWLLLENTPPADYSSTTERWLSENAYKVEEKIFSHFSRLCLFSSPTNPPNPYADKLVIRLGDKIELIGHDFSPRKLKPGGIINISLLWKATSPIEEDYTVFVQLLDEEGFLRAQIDSYPVSGFRPTSSWLEGEVIRDNYGLMLPSDLPPGDYNLICGMYLLRTMERLPIFDKECKMKGDYVHLGVVSIESV
jgi:hypothetical protein